MVRFAAAAFALITSLIGLTASGGPITLLEFSTQSCTYCRQMEPLIHAFEQAGYPIQTIDASVQPQVAQKYGVSRFPTFVMVVNEQEIARHEGATFTQDFPPSCVPLVQGRAVAPMMPFVTDTGA